MTILNRNPVSICIHRGCRRRWGNIDIALAVLILRGCLPVRIGGRAHMGITREVNGIVAGRGIEGDMHFSTVLKTKVYRIATAIKINAARGVGCI